MAGILGSVLEQWDVHHRRKVHDSLVALHHNSISHIYARNYERARIDLVLLVDKIWELQWRYPSLCLIVSEEIFPVIYVVDDANDAQNAGEGHFDDPFPHPLTPICWSTMSQLEFVTLYNLALASHLYALENVASRLPILVKAKEIWKALYAVRTNERYQIQPIHILAILANLASIHLELGDREAAESCFRETLAILAIPRLSQLSMPFSSSFLAHAQYMLNAIQTAPAA